MGHSKINSTYLALKERNIRGVTQKEVKTVIDKCLVYKMYSSNDKNLNNYRINFVRPFNTIAVDMIGPLQPH